ncbi:MAG: alpha-glucan phosphorylase [Candidatus Woesearchaeota archaeon]|nr:MAG: alpha-glucan phosphorylase [Candidatus Woesearchaeota archaeon]
MGDVPKHMDKEYIAYFSMEIGISHSIPTYAGGLGILAGDLLKAFADLKVPVVGITLLNEKGYLKQIIKDGQQLEQPQEWNIAERLVLLPNQIIVRIDGRDVKIRVWKHLIRGISGYNVPVFFLDTNVEGNSEYDKKLTSFLYGGDREYRLAQECILGIGGVRMLESLGYNHIKKYHMNEGHASLLTVELLKKTYKDSYDEEHSYDVEYVRERCVFTTHTPVAAGHDHFDIPLVRKLLGNYIPEFILTKSLNNGELSMTLLGLNLSKYINGVAKRHTEVTREMFPQYSIDSITNGIHHLTWISKPFSELYDSFIPGWIFDPFALRYALSIPKDKILEAHFQSKQALIDEVNSRTNAGYHIARFTIGYARRFTEYKRPDLLLYDINRLKSITEKVGDIQIVFAGKAHPNDVQGKYLIKKIIDIATDINKQNTRLKIVFLDDYDMRLAKILVSGCDVWLNTPQRPFEASGTSGMKAALNGVPQISTLDGWWLEGCIDNVTGWSIGPHPQDPNFKIDPDMNDEAKDLYDKLEQIVPLFYGNKERWTDIMRHCIAINGSFFNTIRMAQQYVANAYIN